MGSKISESWNLDLAPFHAVSQASVVVLEGCRRLVCLGADQSGRCALSWVKNLHYLSRARTWAEMTHGCDVMLHEYQNMLAFNTWLLVDLCQDMQYRFNESLVPKHTAVTIAAP